MFSFKIISFVSVFLVFFCLGESVDIQRHYKTLKFDVPLDHFNFGNNKTFQIKYLLNDTYWDKDDGPIFFYTGNEGTIESFAKYTGFIWEIAEEFQALIVFAEHRYYGESLPFGNKSFSGPQYSGYLSTSQTLADYVDLITFIRKQNGRRNPVIVFGGSYGGMLSAYIRMKYPHIVDGAIAASAPVHQFTGMIPCDAFFRVTTSAFASVSESCVGNIKKSWSTIRSLVSNQAGKDWLSKEWKLCKPLKTDKDTEDLLAYLNDVYTTVAMVNYPYENDFLAELPAYPVRQMCFHLKNDSLAGKQLLKSLNAVVNIYANFTHKSKCLNLNANSENDLGLEGWDYQSCTEMVMPMCSNGLSDMFEKKEWKEKEISEDCKKRFGVTPIFDLAEKLYGGNRLEASSQIIFSNGLLDPWASGGIMRNYSESTYVILIPEGAHHLDLMPSNPSDPYSVKYARKFHKYYINQWIKDSKF